MGKLLSISLRNFCPILVVTLALKGGLNQVILRLRLRPCVLLFCFVSCV